MSSVIEKSDLDRTPKKRVVSSSGNAQGNKATKAIKRHVSAVSTFEASRIAQIELSEKRAWRVAIGSCLITLMSWAVLALLMPLKTIEPYVIRVDEATGGVEILTTAKEQFVSNSETIDNYWVNRFLHSYESYDYFTIQKDYDLVGALATKDVGTQYAAKYIGEDSIDKKYKDTMSIKINVESIVPASEFIKTVRFSKTTTHTRQAIPPKEEMFVATIGYYYDSTVQMTPAQRLVNPLGFYVRSFRIDAEL